MDRAMPATGAAHRDGQIAAAGRLVLRDPPGDEVLDVVDQALHGCMCLKELDHRRIKAREMAQSGFPVGVGQRAHIKYKVGITGYAALEAEGLESDRERTVGLVTHG